MDSFQEPVEWSWKVVKDFIASWDSHTTEDKTKFIEKGYSEVRMGLIFDLGTLACLLCLNPQDI